MNYQVEEFSQDKRYPYLELSENTACITVKKDTIKAYLEARPEKLKELIQQGEGIEVDGID